MTKPNQATVFRKRQVLTARQLTKSLGEYGSQDGVVPYDENSQLDTSFSQPLGTKANPFGDAFFKGMNIYTTIEVQALVSSGKLTETDRMVFWNLDTNTLNAWNGSEIVSVAGGNNSMDYLFGDGSDGNVTMVSDGSYDAIKNFEDFTLNAGVTLSKVTAGSPLVIRCTGTCTINGTINLSGKGFPGGVNTVGYGYGAATGRDALLSGVGYTNRINGGAFDPSAAATALSVLNFDQIPFCGGGGGGSTSTGSSGTFKDTQSGGVGAGAGGYGSSYAYANSSGGTQTATCTGGAGGGGLLIIARKIVIAGSILLTGTNGSYQNNSAGGVVPSWKTKGYGGGGGGGCAAFVGNEISITGSINCAGGAAGGNDTDAPACAGGAGGYIKLVI